MPYAGSGSGPGGVTALFSAVARVAAFAVLASIAADRVRSWASVGVSALSSTMAALTAVVSSVWPTVFFVTDSVRVSRAVAMAWCLSFCFVSNAASASVTFLVRSVTSFSMSAMSGLSVLSSRLSSL